MALTSQIQKKFTTYQGNVYPGMLRSLADNLGVPVEALEKLQLGWAPIVEFKGGKKNFNGWWTIPERDATGKVTGLGLRAHDTSSKSMIPKSKHGLIYSPNPHHEAGAIEHRMGTSIWTRCQTAGIQCPVCHHESSDGCVVAGNVDDPQAAICIRTKSEKPMRLGYLHQIKPVKLSSFSALVPSKHPVIIVEGMTDVAAALGLGLVAVGRPSATAGLDILQTLVRSRDVIIIGENDRKETGAWPGKEGMFATYHQLRGCCPKCVQVLPPEDVKDLREWITKYKLTTETFLAYCRENAEAVDDTLVLEDARSLTAAQSYLMSHHRIGERYTLRYFNDMWYQYDQDANKYVNQKKFMISAPLIQWGHARKAKTPDKDDGFKLIPIDTTQAWVSNVLGGMASECLVPDAQSPCWINGVIGPDPKDLLIFKNGTMHIPSYLAGKPFDEYMRASSPDLFSVVAMPYNWEPQAECPTLHSWIESSLGDDPDKIKLLQEWFGYCMTQDTTQQKLLWMRGVPNGGKGVAISVLRGLVGQDQFGVMEFKGLTDKFAMIDVLDKLVCAFPDFKLPSKGDHAAALGVILSLSGDDPVKMQQKFKDSIDNVQPFARITVAANDLPNFPDHSGALKRRLLLLEFERSFASAPDLGLKAKLNRQLPGIAVWALEGLRRLKATKNFTVPASMVEVINSWEEDANPIGTFLRETTLVKPDSKLLKSELFAIYRAWCFSMGSMACSQMNFKQRLADFYRQDVPNVSRANNVYFEGIAVTPQARKQYLD